MSDYLLKTVEDKKYLGLTLHKNFNWNKQVQNVTMKANNTLSLIHRNIGGCPQPIKECCYTKLIRAIMEYVHVQSGILITRQTLINLKWCKEELLDLCTKNTEGIQVYLL